ncbi:hypothetical protein M3Y94_01017800 [Aphelenchoides besseyi]|nr:hypothetical protein M3Y94_01017800 [Aphelenchoides besseyi]KAI6220558.1 Astacin-like metalloendopeptidase [Aphelenchoides besseyi]
MNLRLFVILFVLCISLSRGQDDDDPNGNDGGNPNGNDGNDGNDGTDPNGNDGNDGGNSTDDPDLPPPDNTEAPPPNTESPVAGDTDAPDNTQEPTTLSIPEEPTTDGETTEPSTVVTTQQSTTPTTTTTTTTAAPKPFDPCTCKSLVGARALLRSNNVQLTDHLYTINAHEQQEIVAQGYRMEKAVGFVATKTPPECPGLVPLHRLSNPVIRNHFYTTNDAEMQNARDHLGYSVENNMGFCSSKPGCGLVPLYRFYNVNQKDHFYTNRLHEKNHVQRNQPGYRFEGIQCYVYA